MADKELTVFVVDLGRSMGQKHHGRDESDLAWSLPCVWERMGQIVSSRIVCLNLRLTTGEIATGRKTALVGVIGFQTRGMA
jgi:ATP-dependent DNA helicase 2 subunit 2